MRPTRILLIAGLSLATAFPTPANALAGACVASSTGVNACVPSQVVCDPGDLITVIVTGQGSGMARCGGATAWCNANGAACVATDAASLRNALDCSVDPFGAGEVIAVCLVTPGFPT